MKRLKTFSVEQHFMFVAWSFYAENNGNAPPPTEN